jgi:tryptophan synthase beta chain
MNITSPIAGPAFGRRDPDPRGYFGRYGGMFAPETLMAPLLELRDAYFALRCDDAFCEDLLRLLVTYAGRP